MQSLTQRMCVLALVALCAGWLGLGCGSDPEESGECTNGASQVCTCDDGQSGTQLCEAEAWQACVCSNASANSSASDAGVDAPNEDAAGDPDVAVRPDATDGGPGGPNNDEREPIACETDEDCVRGCTQDRTVPCVCGMTTFGMTCVPSCETDEDCPLAPGGRRLVCDEDQGLCRPPD